MLVVVGLVAPGQVGTAHAAATGGYPYANDSSAAIDPWGFYKRYCTSYVAWKLNQNGAGFSNGMAGPNGAAGQFGDAKNWDDNAQTIGFAVDQTPAVGAVAVWNGGTYGHVAYVESVNANGTVNVSEYNHGVSLGYGTRQNVTADRYIHIKDIGGSGPGEVAPNVVRVKKKMASDGAHLVYAATRSRVYESWWRPGGDGVHTAQLIHIAQNDIVDIDKVEQPDGTHNLYTAVGDGVWETWWRPGQGLHHNKIISGLSGVRRVIALNQTDGGQLTHLVYVLAADGPHEYWWRDGGDGIHHSRLAHLIDPVDFVRSTTANGAAQLLTATAGAVWETTWVPGGTVSTRNVIGISQNDIVAVDKYAMPDGTQMLYTAVAGGVWQSRWQGTGAPAHTHVVNNLPNVVGVKGRLDSDGVHQLYVAATGKVQEYWWHSGGSGGSTLVVAAGIKDLAISKSGGDYQLYVGSNANVLETWWRHGRAPGTSEIASFD